MDSKAPVITIDGPSASGKGTISQKVAKRLGYHMLDSGALYRVLALAAERHAIGLDNIEALEILAANLEVDFQSNQQGQERAILLEGEVVTETIRTEKVGESASQVAAIPGVRKALFDRQRAFQKHPGLVADGRDMGTIVFPEANLKVFLTASPEERAKRRYKQLKDSGVDVMLATLVKEVAERDARDANRAVAPLKPAEGAIIIDTSHLSVDQVVERVMEEVGEAVT